MIIFLGGIILNLFFSIFFPYIFINSLFLWFYLFQKEKKLFLFLLLTSFLNDFFYLKPFGFFLFVSSLSFLLVSLFFKFFNYENLLPLLTSFLIFNLIIFLFLRLPGFLGVKYFIFNFLLLSILFLFLRMVIKIRL